MELKMIIDKIRGEYVNDAGLLELSKYDLPLLESLITQAYEAGVNKKDGQIETYAQYHFKEGFQSAIKKVRELMDKLPEDWKDERWRYGNELQGRLDERAEILGILTTLQQEE